MYILALEVTYQKFTLQIMSKVQSGVKDSNTLLPFVEHTGKGGQSEDCTPYLPHGILSCRLSTLPGLLR